jgi:hypothetical protein
MTEVIHEFGPEIALLNSLRPKEKEQVVPIFSVYNALGLPNRRDISYIVDMLEQGKYIGGDFILFLPMVLSF